ncbi:uncharacterized protein [Gossypium hirsutum]|uniref:Receptor-like protein kinase n=1 Tax=Gossypium hirsutum TaxID=3635 RepID=A0A1U8MY41_GOSHI|nr:uncharacterized protein LOC107942570 [Gossypium hirsutum]
MALFEALYGRKRRAPLFWFDMKEKRNLGSDLVCEIEDTVKLICDRLKALSDRSDPSHVLPVEEIKVRSNLSYEEEPVVILEREVKVLHSKTVPLVKVLWRNHETKEATWELEDIMRR